MSEVDLKNAEADKKFSRLYQNPEICRRLIINSEASFSINGLGMNFISILKKMIISRETGAQLKAVRCIIYALMGYHHQSNSVSFDEENIIVKKLLDNDFVEFLCESLPYPSTSTANDLLLVIYQCLGLLSSNEEFFQFHAVYAVESVLRSLHFLNNIVFSDKKADLGKEYLTLSSGLSLIALILHGSINRCNLLSSSSKSIDGGSLLERINKLISSTMKLSNLHTKWKSGLVLRSLLNSWHLGSYFQWENENVIESVVEKEVCVFKNVYSEDIKDGRLKEFRRKIPLFNGRVHMIKRKSTLEESEIHFDSNNCHLNGVSNVHPSNELKLIITLLKEIIKELQNCLKGAVVSDCFIKATVIKKFFLLVCQIGKNTLQLLPQEALFSSDCTEVAADGKRRKPSYEEEYFEQIFCILSQPIGELCANILVEMEFKKENSELYKEYFICLEWMYLKFGKFCHKLSQNLAAQGYLTLLTFLVSSQELEDEALLNTSLVILAHLLSQLAETELNWSNSFVILSQGISDLPLHIHSWPSLLASHSSEPTGIAVLIFSYFYCITSREEVAYPFLIPLMQFIKCFYSQSKTGCIAKELSLPLLKALWFSFAISYLSNECPVNTEFEEASQKLNHLIIEFWIKQKGGDLSNIFTYHPALLLWVFSSPAKNSWLQLHVVLLWLERCDSSKSCHELETLLILNQDAFICLMEITEISCIKVAECAIRTLWGCIQKAELEEKKKISSNIWEILLQMIQRFSALEYEFQKERATNISCMLQLVQTSVLVPPSSSITIRLACLVTSAIACRQSTLFSESLEKNQYILYLSGLKMLDFLLGISVVRGDFRVASSMLSHDGFMQRLEWAANLCPKSRSMLIDVEKEDGTGKENSLNDQFFEDFNSVACLVLEKLLFMNPVNSQGAIKSFSLNSWHLLLGIASKHECLCHSSLKFFHTLVQVHVMKSSLLPRTFMKIIKTQHSESICFSDVSFFRTLYLHIIMICTKATSAFECYCWEFMSLALKLPNKSLASHLLKLPWNISLINSKLPNDMIHNEYGKQISAQSSSLSLSFIHFINEWLSKLRGEIEIMGSSTTFSKRKESMENAFPSLLRQAIYKIGRTIVINDDETSLKIKKQEKSSAMRNTILMILSFKRIVPESLCSDLKNKLSQL